MHLNTFKSNMLKVKCNVNITGQLPSNEFVEEYWIDITLY